MEILKKFGLSPKIYISVLIIIFGFIFYKLIKKMAKNILSKDINKKIDKKTKTYLRLFKNIFKYLLVFLIIGIVLNINGVNITSLLAGVGVASVIVGLALQDALKDIIMGLNIIFDDYFKVGDFIQIGNISGKVIQIGLKVTKIKDYTNQNIYVIANRNINDALVLSNQLDIDIPLHYEEKTEKIEKIMELIVQKIKKEEKVENCEYKGINSFENSSVNYKIRVYTEPDQKPDVKRKCNRIIKETLDKNNIEIPYNQLDIHKKN